MRILLVSHYTLPHYGGIEVVVENLAKGLVQQGHEVKVFSSLIEGPKEEKRHGFEVFRVPAWNFLERYAVPYPIFSPSSLRLLQKLTNWADVVHAHGFLYQSTLFAFGAALKAKRPRVLTEHAGFVRYSSRFWNLLQNIAIHSLGSTTVRLANAVVVVGTRAQSLIETLVPHKPLFLIPNGIDTQYFHPVSEKKKEEIRRYLMWDARPKVLSVGRLVPRKGLSLLLEALDPSYDLVLCGRGESILPLKENMLVYHSPDDDLLRLIYQAADLYVLPSHSEGAFPLAAQEAMACGLPVIAVFDPVYLSYVSSEVVDFVEPSARALRVAIRSLLDSPHKRKQRSLLSRRWARTHFVWKRNVEAHLALYQTLLERGAL